MQLLAKQQKGITIVEVMLSLTILGLVLGLSYSTASRTLRNARDSQERSEAYQYGQSIVDAIKHYSLNYEITESGPNPDKLYPASSDPFSPDNTETFCISTNADEVRVFAPVQAPGSGACSKNDLYTSTVTATNVTGPLATDVPTYLYEVSITWQNLASNETSELSLRYRISKVIAP